MIANCSLHSNYGFDMLSDCSGLKLGVTGVQNYTFDLRRKELEQTSKSLCRNQMSLTRFGLKD
jgi:hypothetical protein